MSQESGEIYTDSSSTSSDDDSISELLPIKNPKHDPNDVKDERSSESPNKLTKSKGSEPTAKEVSKAVDKLIERNLEIDDSSDDEDSEDELEVKSELFGDLGSKVKEAVPSNTKSVSNSQETNEKSQSPKRKRNKSKTTTTDTSKNVKEEPKAEEQKKEESEPKPKKPRKPKTKTEKSVEVKEEMKKLSNEQVFKSLKDKIDDIPLGELKSKLLTDSSSESSDSPLSEESDESDDESPITEPQTTNQHDGDEEVSDDTDLVEEPKKRKSEEINGFKSGEQFINKERLKKTFKTKLDIPEGCEIYCGNLPVESTEEELREFFEECGKITRVNKLNGKGIAFITFANEEAAKKALDYNNSPYKGQNLSINITVKKGPKSQKFGSNRRTNFHSSGSNSGTFGTSGPSGSRSAPTEATNEICIRNLNFNSSEEGLRELFSECGQVTRCYVPKFQDTGKPMGIGFISFTTVEAAKRAVEYDNTDIDGRTVSIQFALPRGGRSSRGRATKGRFTTGMNKSATFSRSFGQNKPNRDDNLNGTINPSSEQDNKPKSIIFDDD
uniref:Nucleolar, RNA-binding protein, putative n=1 Tax=Theileria annulata TaxID=5874 RepID=A0A3B0MUF9_THEAN